MCFRCHIVLWTYKYCTYPYIGFSKIFYIVFEICFAQFSKQTICPISFRRLLEEFLACTWTRIIFNLCHDCFRGNILIFLQWVEPFDLSFLIKFWSKILMSMFFHKILVEIIIWFFFWFFLKALKILYF